MKYYEFTLIINNSTTPDTFDITIKAGFSLYIKSLRPARISTENSNPIVVEKSVETLTKPRCSSIPSYWRWDHWVSGSTSTMMVSTQGYNNEDRINYFNLKNMTTS